MYHIQPTHLHMWFLNQSCLACICMFIEFAQELMQALHTQVLGMVCEQIVSFMIMQYFLLFLMESLPFILILCNFIEYAVSDIAIWQI